MAARSGSRRAYRTDRKGMEQEGRETAMAMRDISSQNSVQGGELRFGESKSNSCSRLPPKCLYTTITQCNVVSSLGVQIMQGESRSFSSLPVLMRIRNYISRCNRNCSTTNPKIVSVGLSKLFVVITHPQGDSLHYSPSGKSQLMTRWR